MVFTFWVNILFQQLVSETSECSREYKAILENEREREREREREGGREGGRG